MRNIIKRSLKKFLPQFCVNTIHFIRRKQNDVLLINVNHVNLKKKALISYITEPFRKETKTHSNQLEVRAISETLDELGYSVDVVFFDSKRKIDYREYDLIIGFGDPFINSFFNDNSAIKICYTTGCHVSFQNRQTLERAKYAKEHYGQFFLDSTRLVEKTWTIQTMLPDAIITLGSRFAADTFCVEYNGPIYSVPAIAYKSFHNIEKNDSEILSGRSHFLWFGSKGAIHKGLDLLLIYFKRHPDIDLHICASINSEPSFCNYFHEYLYNTENIHYHGFVNIDSDKYVDIINSCTFVILPSCSEGSATSVICTMLNGGLIPVVTKESGVVLDGFGVEIENISLSGIDDAVQKALDISDNQLIQMTRHCKDYTSTHNNYNALKEQMIEILKEVSDGHTSSI